MPSMDQTTHSLKSSIGKVLQIERGARMRTEIRSDLELKLSESTLRLKNSQVRQEIDIPLTHALEIYAIKPLYA